ncbi:hypothetical protein C0583_05100 [Candidatus Parcubacteria bacterium]|nr:MAG: hypothetical protein C0583_05100 [Candidatus Parcubacteria bacterium]
MYKKIVQSFLLVMVFIFALPCLAQEKMTMTITPPIIRNNVVPGQIWKSYVKVVNNNPHEITVYASLMNFESKNDTCTVNFTPLSNEEIAGNPFLINNWVIIEDGPIAIPANQSKQIPFIVDVPDEINPGGHRIAILIGTKPNDEEEEEGSVIKISSMLSSLLFLNINGDDVNESGIIREFSSDKDIYSEGEANFVFKFQNTGDSILQPQGVIKIYNYKDEEQGEYKINHQTISGNVLPGDTRKWEYDWQIPDELLEMGKYRAELIVAFGTDEHRETIERNLYFWVLQWKPITILLGSFFLIIFIMVWLVRRSIRKAVINAQKQYGIPVTPTKTKKVSVHEEKDEVLDLKVNANKVESKSTRTRARFPLLKITFIFIFIVLLGSVALMYYLNKGHEMEIIESTSEEQGLNEKVPVDNFVDDTEESLTPEDDTQEEITKEEKVMKDVVEYNFDAAIEILNGGGLSGAATKAKEVIEEQGYKVIKTGNANSFDYEYTVINYKTDLKNDAKRIAEDLGVVPDLKELSDEDFDIQIIIGSDFKIDGD